MFVARMALSKILDPRAPSPEVELLLDKIRRSVIGQVDAIDELVRCYIRWRVGLAPTNKPIGAFLFLGPTGVGKTLTAEAFSVATGHAPSTILRIDCAEFIEKHDLAKLIGAPPGYLGHRETKPLFSQASLLSQHTNEAPFSIVLFDEVDKAHPALFDMILGILDYGEVKNGENQTINFRNTLVIMTANFGAQEMADTLAPRFGLRPQESPVSPEEMRRNISGIGTKVARKGFRPEFFNRLTKVLTFHPLGEEELAEILGLEIVRLEQKLAAAGHLLALHLDPEAFEHLLHVGYDPRYGARHLQRAVSLHLEHPLANLLASGQIEDRANIQIRLTDGDLEFLEI